MTQQAIAYTAEALSTGDGRNGHVRTSEGTLDLDLAFPKELGGSGLGSNPELLFAAGYAACYHSALRAAAKQQGVELVDDAVGTKVGIGPSDLGGFELSILIEVVLPGVDPKVAQELADAAHALCPYSRATRGNIPVEVRVVEG